MDSTPDTCGPRLVPSTVHRSSEAGAADAEELSGQPEGSATHACSSAHIAPARCARMPPGLARMLDWMNAQLLAVCVVPAQKVSQADARAGALPAWAAAELVKPVRALLMQALHAPQAVNTQRPAHVSVPLAPHRQA